MNTNIVVDVKNCNVRTDKEEPKKSASMMMMMSNSKRKRLIKQQEILRSIDELTNSIIYSLDKLQDPTITRQPSSNNDDMNVLDESNTNPDGIIGTTCMKKSFVKNISQSRSYTSILLVLSFVQKNLLLSNRTTTNREVYYYFVTHFRNQRECDSAIVEVSNMLNVDRANLGIFASPKGKIVKYRF